MSDPLPWPNCPRCREPLPPGPSLCPHCGAVTGRGRWLYAAGVALLLPAVLAAADYLVQGTCLARQTDMAQRTREALSVLGWGLLVCNSAIALAALVMLRLRSGGRYRGC